MTKPLTRIQIKNRATILDAGLQVFSQYGFRGTTLDQIATEAGLSKPNLIYYFESKDAIYRALLDRLLETWLQPIHEIDPRGDPVEELVGYAMRKLEMSRRYPAESRLFAMEIIQGAPLIHDILSGDLRQVVERVGETIRTWTAQGRLAPVDPAHLLFSIWAMTQHYADFDVQVRAVLGDGDPFPDAEAHLDRMLRALLEP